MIYYSNNFEIKKLSKKNSAKYLKKLQKSKKQKYSISYIKKIISSSKKLITKNII